MCQGLTWTGQTFGLACVVRKRARVAGGARCVAGGVLGRPTCALLARCQSTSVPIADVLHCQPLIVLAVTRHGTCRHTYFHQLVMEHTERELPVGEVAFSSGCLASDSCTVMIHPRCLTSKR